MLYARGWGDPVCVFVDVFVVFGFKVATIITTGYHDTQYTIHINRYSKILFVLLKRLQLARNKDVQG
jgi:hypothetical protein